jgi:hypothetical protein
MLRTTCTITCKPTISLPFPLSLPLLSSASPRPAAPPTEISGVPHLRPRRMALGRAAQAARRGRFRCGPTDGVVSVGIWGDASRHDDGSSTALTMALDRTLVRPRWTSPPMHAPRPRRPLATPRSGTDDCCHRWQPPGDRHHYQLCPTHCPVHGGLQAAASSSQWRSWLWGARAVAADHPAPSPRGHQRRTSPMPARRRAGCKGLPDGGELPLLLFSAMAPPLFSFSPPTSHKWRQGAWQR